MNYNLLRPKKTSIETGDYCIMYSYKDINNIFVRKAIQFGNTDEFYVNNNVYEEILRSTGHIIHLYYLLHKL